MNGGDEAGIEADLAALGQGRLDPEQLVQVADYLAARPERAAEVVGDVRNIAGLQLALSMSVDPPPETLVAEARRLENRFRRRRFARRLAPAAGAVVLFAAGWASHATWEADDAHASPLVEAALDAQAALELRHWMTSQPESREVDADEIVAALGVTLPTLPEGWTIRDVQIVAAPERPGVAVSLYAPALGPVMLFVSALGAGEGDGAPAAFEYAGRSVAVFERGRSAYVLIDEFGQPDQLSAGADLLMSRLD